MLSKLKVMQRHIVEVPQHYAAHVRRGSFIKLFLKLRIHLSCRGYIVQGVGLSIYTYYFMFLSSTRPFKVTAAILPVGDL